MQAPGACLALPGFGLHIGNVKHWSHRTTQLPGRCLMSIAGNSGSRRDAEEILYHLLPKGITVFAFDFAVSRCFLVAVLARPAAS